MLWICALMVLSVTDSSIAICLLDCPAAMRWTLDLAIRQRVIRGVLSDLAGYLRRNPPFPGMHRANCVDQRLPEHYS